MVTSGTPSAFQGEVVGLEYSGDMPQPPWYSVMDLSINLRLSEALTLCLLPSTFWCGRRHVTPDLILLKAFTVKGKR